MERDDGNLYVLEGVLIALMLLGAAYGVGTLRASSLDQERPRMAMTKTANDALVLLEGLEEGNGTLLDVFLREAMHCAFDTAPSALQCDGERPRNLSLRVDNYLAPGAGWALSISNGLATREVYRTPLPGREAVASSLSYGPGWNGTFIATELSCYEAGMDVRATLIPLDRARVVSATAGNAIAGSLDVAGVPSVTPKWWDVTLPAATRPAASLVLANVSGAGAKVPGATSYASCDLHGKGAVLVTALRTMSFTTSATSVRVGGSVDFSANVGLLDSVSETDVLDATVTVYEPVGPRLNESDTWIPAAVIDLDAAGAGTWEPAGHSFFGTRVAMLDVDLRVDGTTFTAHRFVTLDVALPTGEVPIDPPYRAMLHAWMADWG